MRYYSSIAQPTTLSTSIGSSDLTIAVVSTVGYPTSFPFTAALDAGGASEELVDVTAIAGNVWTVTRGVDGTSAQSHSAGAVVRHSSSGRDFAEAQSHIAATSGVHGVTGALVGTTNTQTLTNKTFTTPTINGGALTGTFTGTPQYSGALLFTGDPVFQAATTADTAASVRVAADANPRLALRGDGALVFGSGAAAGDAILSRPGAGVLATSGGLNTGGAVAASGAVGATVANTTDAALQAQLTGDTSQRFVVGGDGKLSWGSGVATRDTTLYRSGVNALKTDGDLRVAGGLTVDGVGQKLVAIKSSNTSRANTAAIAHDPHLAVTLAANATYEIRGLLLWGNSHTGGIVMGWDIPSGASGSWSTIQPDTSAAGDPTSVRVIASDIAAGRFYGWFAYADGSPAGAPLTGLIKTTTAGTLSFQWAQFTANATATIAYANSYIVLERVA